MFLSVSFKIKPNQPFTPPRTSGCRGLREDQVGPLAFCGKDISLWFVLCRSRHHETNNKMGKKGPRETFWSHGNCHSLFLYNTVVFIPACVIQLPIRDSTNCPQLDQTCVFLPGVGSCHALSSGLRDLRSSRAGLLGARAGRCCWRSRQDACTASIVIPGVRAFPE